MENARKSMIIVVHGIILEFAYLATTVMILGKVNVSLKTTIKQYKILYVKHGMELFVMNAPIELFSIKI
jgi:hypothetical protein